MCSVEKSGTLWKGPRAMGMVVSTALPPRPQQVTAGSPAEERPPDLPSWSFPLADALILFQFTPATLVPSMFLKPPGMFPSQELVPYSFQKALPPDIDDISSLFSFKSFSVGLFRISHFIAKIAILPTWPYPIRFHFSFCSLFFSLALIMEHTILPPLP